MSGAVCACAISSGSGLYFAKMDTSSESESPPSPSSQQRPSISDIVTPPNRTAAIWRHFGLTEKESSSRVIALYVKPVVPLSLMEVEQLTYEITAHYYELFPTTSTEQPGLSKVSKQDKVDRYFPQTDKIPLQSQRYKVLTEAVASFITRDMRPVNVVDGVGFLKLMQMAEPRYVVPCRKTVMKVIDQQYQGLRHGELAIQK